MLFTSGAPALPRLPTALDPLRRVPVPRDLAPLTVRAEHETDPAAAGMSSAGVERIWSAAERLYRTGMYPALALCVRRDGQVVLDRALGWARGVGPGEPRDAEPVPATPDTPFCVFSASKAITATVVHQLAERGLIDLGDRVGEYLPEFRVKQLAQITVDHVLSHRAGIPLIPSQLMDLDRLGDRDYLRTALGELRVCSRPGARVAYHALSGGFVLGELVQEVAGTDLRTVLDEQILTPLGFRWTNYGAARADQQLVAHDVATGPRTLPPLSTAIGRALGMSVERVCQAARDPRFLDGIVPAGNVVSTANETSRFMDLLRAGGTLDGVSVLRPQTVRRATAERSYHRIDHTLGAPLRYSSGFMLGARTLSLYGPDTDEAFGHLGFTNVMAWADPRRELAVGLMTNGNPVVGPHLPLLWDLTRRIGAAAPKVADPLLYRS